MDERTLPFIFFFLFFSPLFAETADVYAKSTDVYAKGADVAANSMARVSAFRCVLGTDVN